MGLFVLEEGVGGADLMFSADLEKEFLVCVELSTAKLSYHTRSGGMMLANSDIEIRCRH